LPAAIAQAALAKATGLGTKVTSGRGKNSTVDGNVIDVVNCCRRKLIADCELGQ
jgi:hypothetical protein